MNFVTDTHANPSHRNAVDIIAFEAELERRVVANETSTFNNETSNVPNCVCSCSTISQVPLRSVALVTNEQSEPTTEDMTQHTENHHSSPATDSTPSFTDLLTALTSKIPPPSPPHVEVELMIYDSRTGTATARLSASSTAPLTHLFAAIPCTTVTPTSSVLYVNNVFYEHTHPSCADYSSSLADFILTHRKTALPQPTILRFTGSDDAPKVHALRPILGKPYVYIHDGDCEHRVIFTDVRRARTNAAERGQVRTLLSWVPRIQSCDVCYIRAARYAVFSDKLAPYSPFHYCNPCRERAYPDPFERAQLKSVKHPNFVREEEETR